MLTLLLAGLLPVSGINRDQCLERKSLYEGCDSLAEQFDAVLKAAKGGGSSSSTTANDYGG